LLNRLKRSVMVRKSVFIERGNVACGVPAIAQDLGCLLGSGQVALHDVGPRTNSKPGWTEEACTFFA
jgi:hypothetical protein